MENIFKFKKMIREKSEEQTYSYGCVMGFFDSPIANIEIADEDVYNNEANEFGREIEPHVTVLYGLLDDQIDEVDLLEFLSMVKCPQVSSKIVSLFENDEYDVVKFDIESSGLVILNDILSKAYPNENKYPEYHAHSTIAYCVKGTGSKYIQVLMHEEIKEISYWVYSMANGKKVKINPVDQTIEVLREADGVESEIDEIETDTKLLNEPESQVVETYYGYQIKCRPHARFKDAFIFTVYNEKNIYAMGIKGPVPYNKGLEACKYFIDGKKMV